MRVLIIGSGPNAVEAKDWDAGAFDAIVAINNGWQIRDDFTHWIHPEDFPPDRAPSPGAYIEVTAQDYVPVQNELGGFVYAGGTMAFTAGYWVLGALRPSEMAFIGCDMVYAKSGDTHFYGKGEADPLRDDITLQNLEAKAARLMCLASARGCGCINLSSDESRLVFDRAQPARVVAEDHFAEALAAEAALGYMAEDGRYWLEEEKFDARKLAEIDALWLKAIA